jgi:hypothetical protein
MVDLFADSLPPFRGTFEPYYLFPGGVQSNANGLAVVEYLTSKCLFGEIVSWKLEHIYIELKLGFNL